MMESRRLLSCFRVWSKFVADRRVMSIEQIRTIYHYESLYEEDRCWPSEKGNFVCESQQEVKNWDSLFVQDEC